MAADFESVELSEFTSAGELQKIADSPLRLTFDRKDKEEALLFQKGDHVTSYLTFNALPRSCFFIDCVATPNVKSALVVLFPPS